MATTTLTFAPNQHSYLKYFIHVIQLDAGMIVLQSVADIAEKELPHTKDTAYSRVHKYKVT